MLILASDYNSLTHSLVTIRPISFLHPIPSVTLATGWWFSPDTRVSSTNKTDRYDITEILLKVALNTLNQNFDSNQNLSYVDEAIVKLGKVHCSPSFYKA
jgi:hypothetical protein